MALNSLLLNRTHMHSHRHPIVQIKLGQLFCLGFPEMVMCLLQLFSTDVFMAISVSPAFPSLTPGNIPLQPESLQLRPLRFLCAINIDYFPLPLEVTILSGLFLFSPSLRASALQLVLFSRGSWYIVFGNSEINGSIILFTWERGKQRVMFQYDPNQACFTPAKCYLT